MSDLTRLVDEADPAALLLAVDRLHAARDWDGLVELARRCRAAVEMGHQLWPVAMHVDYRLALDAPARWASAVVRPGAAPFALGPLTEVVAQRHTWDELAPHLPDPAAAAAVAQERALRREDVAAPGLPHELPPRLLDFEPSYVLPTYDERRITVPSPPGAADAVGPAAPLATAEALPHDAGARALAVTVEAWTSQSSAQVGVAVVEGDMAQAVGALCRQAAIRRIAPAEALAWLQWAGASGGTHGRRRGGAAGRFAAWWAAAALAGLEWPVTADDHFGDELGSAIDELRWGLWDRPGDRGGWVLRLAVADPLDGLAWAIDARDPPPVPTPAAPASSGGL